MRTVSLLLSIFTLFSISLAQSPRHTEVLGRPTDQSISIEALFDAPVEVRADYGTQPGVYTSQTAWLTFAADEPAVINLIGLQPNTKYYYRLAYRAPGASTPVLRPEYHFQTMRSKGSSFTFIVQADPHLDEQSDTGIYSRCLKNQLEDNPDFMIDLGDILMSDKLKNKARVLPRDTITYRSRLLRSYYEKVCHSMPLFIALGNHEGEAGWNLNGTPDNVAVWGTTDRKKFFPNPSPDNFYSGDTTRHKYVGVRENYYAWQWGDALFIILDPYWYTPLKPDSLNGWRWTLGKTQYDWLKTTLENSTSTYKFVFAHQLVGGATEGRGGVEFADRYEWGGNNLDGTPGFAKNRPGWYKPIKDLLTEHRVTIFFHGHDHFFGKQEKECLIYQEVPQPSHPNFSSANQAKDYGYFEGQILPNSGHVRVTVDPNGVKVDYVRVYLPRNETGTRHNKDVSATYYIGKINCYDSLTAGIPILWNRDYADELVYPNPFREETRIEWNVTVEERIHLKIMDEQGRLVRTLLSGNKVHPGRFQLIWDGKNDLGNSVSSGVYWYTIQGETSGERSGKLIYQN